MIARLRREYAIRHYTGSRGWTVRSGHYYLRVGGVEVAAVDR